MASTLLHAAELIFKKNLLSYKLLLFIKPVKISDKITRPGLESLSVPSRRNAWPAILFSQLFVDKLKPVTVEPAGKQTLLSQSIG